MDISLDLSHSSQNYTHVGWVDGPSGRGTLSIIVSCVSSLFLSAWAVMHLNIPKQHSSMTHHLITYMYWCLYGIFGPELVIWSAWRQLLSALSLRKQLMKENLVTEKWTVSHGFYTLMGGFVVDLDDPSLPPFTDGIRRLSITPKGLLFLAKCGFLPQMSKEDIEDKSKIDELGKVLACTQVTWMVVQVCTRLIVKLPVTVLEVTAVSHVVCALVLYALWWHKPRKVAEPSILTGDWIRPLAAFMLMCSRESQSQLLPGFTLKGEQSEIAGLKLVLHAGEPDDYDFVQKYGTSSSMSASEQSLLTQPHNNEERLEAHHESPELDVDGLHVKYEDSERGKSASKQEVQSIPRPILRARTDVEHEANATTRLRWELAKEAIRTYPTVRQLLRRPPQESDRRYEEALATYPEMPERCRKPPCVETVDLGKPEWLECDTQHFVSIVADDWPHDGLLRPTSGLWIGTAIWLASILYSSIHIAAWYAAFPTTIEMWLWRATSVYIAFSGVLWSGLHAIAEYSARLWWAWYDVMTGEAPKPLMICMYLVCGSCGMAYLFARAYLILEAFVSLRSLPLAAYVVPNWTLGVPHIA